MNRRNLRYHQADLPEHRGNPLIEALPAIKGDDEVLKKLINVPVCKAQERDLPPQLRKMLVQRILELIQPIPEYLTYFRAIENAIFSGYSTKNPFSPTTAHYLHYLDSDETPVQPVTGRFQPCGSATTIIGDSGLGKSVMLNNVLNYFPQVLEHKQYHGRKLNLKQIVWVRMDCPHDASISGFCIAAFQAIEDLLGVKIVEDAFRGRPSVEKMQNVLERLIRTSFIGLIAIDEFSNIHINKSGGLNKLLKWLLNLMNRSGVPFVFSGTWEMADILTKQLRIARRSEAGGTIIMDVLPPEVWDIFVKRLWRLQWTNPPTKLSQELYNRLARIADGSIDTAVKVFMKAQQLVIGSGDERITSSVLDSAFRLSCPLTQAARRIIQTDNNALKNIELNFDSGMELDSEIGEKEVLMNLKDQADKNLVPGDLTRVQHPEFRQNILSLRTDESMLNKINNSDIVRSAAGKDNPLSYFKDAGLLLEQPLIISP